MRHYEILLLIHPDQTAQVPAMLERYQTVITKGGGKIHRQEDWGKQQLAYQINKLYKAHYVLLNIECEKTTLNELFNLFKFNDAVIRNLVTKCEHAIKEPSVFFKNKDTTTRDSNYNNKDFGYEINAESNQSEVFKG
jgi:small subunit ribosomal protein S6